MTVPAQTTVDLLAAARSVRDNAHAPYSQFKVGAALRAGDGKIYVGCNVENIAYPEGTCAEAGAIAAMAAAGQRVIQEIAVIASSPSPVPPCGGCRQKIKEFADNTVLVHMATLDGAIQTVTVADLLPGAFASEHMT